MGDMPLVHPYCTTIHYPNNATGEAWVVVLAIWVNAMEQITGSNELLQRAEIYGHLRPVRAAINELGYEEITEEGKT